MKRNVNIFPFKIIFRLKYFFFDFFIIIIIISLSQHVYNNKHYLDYL